ncbi:MAG: ester cyclase [Bacteriovoracaceae bacterium]|nr:ester cyclase [Bacteroidota bacterium]
MMTNKETALAVSRAIMNGTFNDLDTLLADDFTYTGDGLMLNKDQYIGFMQGLKDAMSNMTMDFTHIISDGDIVSIRFITKAKNTGKFMGAPASNKNVEVHGIFMRKIENGKVLQEWQTTDLLGLMSQMGFGALFGYSVAVGLFKAKTKIPARKR